MVWVQLRDGKLLQVPGTAWQVGKDTYDILEAPGKSVATLTKENVIGIYKKLPTELRQEVLATIVEKMEGELDSFLQKHIPGPEKDDARRAILDWLGRLKAEVAGNQND